MGFHRVSGFLSFVRLLEECFVTKDPFSPDREKFLILGSECSLCRKRVCVGSVSGSLIHLLITCTVAGNATKHATTSSTLGKITSFSRKSIACTVL